MESLAAGTEDRYRMGNRHVDRVEIVIGCRAGQEVAEVAMAVDLVAEVEIVAIQKSFFYPII